MYHNFLHITIARTRAAATSATDLSAQSAGLSAKDHPTTTSGCVVARRLMPGAIAGNGKLAGVLYIDIGHKALCPVSQVLKNYSANIF